MALAEATVRSDYMTRAIPNANSFKCIRKAGYMLLEKKKHLFTRTWHMRYLILTRNALYYYETPSSLGWERQSGAILLKDVSVVEGKVKEANQTRSNFHVCQIQLRMKTGANRRIRTTSPEKLTEWMSALTKSTTEPRVEDLPQELMVRRWLDSKFNNDWPPKYLHTVSATRRTCRTKKGPESFCLFLSTKPINSAAGCDELPTSEKRHNNNNEAPRRITSVQREGLSHPVFASSNSRTTWKRRQSQATTATIESVAKQTELRGSGQ